MAILRPDATTTLNGVKINEYLLTKHNPNHIDMPSVSMEGKVIGVTVHNTDWITVASGTTPAEQYTRATVNNNMRDVRVHYYVDNVQLPGLRAYAAVHTEYHEGGLPADGGLLLRDKAFRADRGDLSAAGGRRPEHYGKGRKIPRGVCRCGYHRVRQDRHSDAGRV